MKILYVAEKGVLDIHHHINLTIGPIDEILSAKCTRHRALLKYFFKGLEREKERGILSIFREYETSSFSYSHKEPPAIRNVLVLSG
jgi:hypothetical protein